MIITERRDVTDGTHNNLPLCQRHLVGIYAIHFIVDSPGGVYISQFLQMVKDGPSLVFMGS